MGDPPRIHAATAHRRWGVTPVRYRGRSGRMTASRPRPTGVQHSRRLLEPSCRVSTVASPRQDATTTPPSHPTHSRQPGSASDTTGSWQQASSNTSSTAPTDSSALGTTSSPARGAVHEPATSRHRRTDRGAHLAHPPQPPRRPCPRHRTAGEPAVSGIVGAAVPDGADTGRRDRAAPRRDTADEPAADAHRPRPLPDRRSAGVGDRVGASSRAVHGCDPVSPGERLNTPGRPWVRRFLRVLTARVPGRSRESDWERRVCDGLVRRGVSDLESQVNEKLPGFGNVRFDLGSRRSDGCSRSTSIPSTARSKVKRATTAATVGDEATAGSSITSESLS